VQWRRARRGASFSIAVCNGKEQGSIAVAMEKSIQGGCIIFYCSVQWKRAFKGVHHFLLQCAMEKSIQGGASFSIAVAMEKSKEGRIIFYCSVQCKRARLLNRAKYNQKSINTSMVLKGCDKESILLQKQ